MFKPFKPPLIKRIPKPAAIDLTNSDTEPSSPPTKKRRLSSHQVIEESPPRKPATHASQANSPPALSGPEGYFLVLWRKFTAKKHKTWDGDGVLSLHDGYARLQDVSGREMGRCRWSDPLLPGSTLSIGGKEVEVDELISKADFLAGKPFLKSNIQRASTTPQITTIPKKAPIPTVKAPLLAANTKLGDDDDDALEIPAKSFYGSTPKTTAMKAQFKNPLLSTTVMSQNRAGTPTPRHDPNAPGAVVMKRPVDIPKGKQVVDVVIDPFLNQHLREHQREGVKFLYECVMGMREFNGQGAVLADEMGLGKTLQTIALLWTLLKQNPIHGGSEGVIKKALIVCPVTLINNWKQEFRKWLGNERLGVFIADGQNGRITDFTHGKSYSIMIIGYEKLRSIQDDLKKGNGIDIIIADEGHRLKTAANKSAQAIRSLNTDRRVILSGTPIQNDLSEFYIMVDFVNPGLLGTYNMFKKEFEGPILKSRQPGASSNDIEKGSAREEELAATTKQFILRRTAEILSKYLKPKTEYVLFCKPTTAQAQLYRHILESPVFGKVLGSTEASLQLITVLKKVCNSPSMLVRKDKDAVSTNTNVAQLVESIPGDILKQSPIQNSSKFRVLDRILRQLSKTTSEKIVIVSNYTSTLDILGNHVASLGLPFLRLDGKTPSSKRQDMVNAFNKTPASQNFAFLLSAKSGGAGLNLIGASRLILFDVDWNPATDLQAMARIHRDGQKRPVMIYRFLMAGGMDEKIYQRQVTKMGLADSVVDGKKNEASFSAEELRDLFTLNVDAGCQTHDLLGCDCKGLGTEPIGPPISTEIETSDEDLDDPPFKLLRASQVNMKEQEDRLAQKKRSKGKMQALMRYSHIDTSVFLGETKDVFGYDNEEVGDIKAVLNDRILVDVLEDHKCKVGFVFAKKG
ncbi:DNA repair and recombination protein rad54 [Phlyctema vagabunda]|uniref:DNA repair and recombination protein rad54 n=1 Tax=Phlyctema vagabunda TaxID=108571 RepID=A0ABR4PQL0_9HELO